MADTTTTNYGLVKPEVGASNDTWGNKTNGNWDALDAALKAASDIANAAMPKAGGTFTGAVNFTGALTKDGNNVWHAGNFTPANYAPLAGAIFTGAVQSTQFVALGGSLDERLRLCNVSPYLSFNDAPGTHRFGYIQHAGAGGSMVFYNGEAGSFNFAYPAGGTFAQITSSGSTFAASVTGGSLVSNAAAPGPSFHYLNIAGATKGYVGADNTGQLYLNANGSLINFQFNANPPVGTISSSGVYTGAMYSANGGGTGEGLRLNASSPYLSWYNPAGSTRFGYLQHTGVNIVLNNEQNGAISFNAGGATVLNLISGSATVSGAMIATSNVQSPTHYIDGNYALYLSSGNPLVQFDTSDYMQYDRAANNLNVVIGGSNVFTVLPTGEVLASTAFTASRINMEANFYQLISGGNPIINFDGNDFIQYDRANNKYNFYINGVSQMSLDASGILRVRGNVIGNTAP